MLSPIQFSKVIFAKHSVHFDMHKGGHFFVALGHNIGEWHDLIKKFKYFVKSF